MVSRAARNYNFGKAIKGETTNNVTVKVKDKEGKVSSVECLKKC